MKWTTFLVVSSLLLASQAVGQDYGSGVPHAGGVNWGPAAAGGEAAADWSASFLAWWGEEEADNATALADDSTTCGSAGSDCDLADGNTVPRDATNFVEGAKSANFTTANSEYQTCTDATCGELDMTSSFSLGCWLRSDDISTNGLSVMRNWDGTNGFLVRAYATGRVQCLLGPPTKYSTTDNNALALTTWAHWVCVYDDTAQTIQNYIDAATNGGTGNCSGVCTIAADTSDFFVGYSSSPFDGRLDECFVRSGTLSTAQICRICSCQINGKLCMCDAATPANYKSCSVDADCQVNGNTTALCNGGTCVGRNSTETPNCGSCTLPDCNAAAP